MDEPPSSGPDRESTDGRDRLPNRAGGPAGTPAETDPRSAARDPADGERGTGRSHQRAEPGDRGRARAALRVGRLFVVLVILVGAALAVTMFAPQVLDVVSEGPSPLESESAPPAEEAPPMPTDGAAEDESFDGSEREAPDPADPGDPGTTAYESGEVAVTADAVEYYVHVGVNERRADHGLDPIDWDGTIASVSRAHSADMHERSYFAHETPGGDDPFDRFGAVANYCRAYGENIARTWVDSTVERPDATDEVVRYETAEQLGHGLVEQWMHSPPHREAILSEDWERGGVGVHLAADGEVHATHNFCHAW